MKKIITVILAFALIASISACGSEPTETPEASASPSATAKPTLEPTPEPTPAPTPTPNAETYSVTIRTERHIESVDLYDMVDVWRIDGVFAEGKYVTEDELFSLRVFYVTEENCLTTLADFYPYDYPYRGAFYLNDDNAICYDYNKLKEYGIITTDTDESGDSYQKSGSYYKNLPKGSWYFGDARFSNSFIVVVGDYEAAKNGTVPENK